MAKSRDLNALALQHRWRQRSNDEVAVLYDVETHADDDSRLVIRRRVNLKAYRVSDRHQLVDDQIADLSIAEARDLIRDLVDILTYMIPTRKEN